MKKIIIQKNNSGIRIDKFLKEEVFFNDKITRGEIIRQIKIGNILLNGKKIKPSYILKIGDEVIINIPKKNTELVPNKNIKLEIIFQDKNFIIINKPAGMQVHPSNKNETDTLVNGLICKFPEIKTVGDDPKIRPGIVHRLDKDTSGVMVIARNQEAFNKLKDKFKNREITKTYWALVYGKLENKSGIINKPIARAGNYKKQTIASAKTKTKIRPAVTEYKILKEFENYSLIEAIPKTGRMHQIRIHLASIGHPVIGDEKYILKNISANENTVRQMLHAKNIEFKLNGKKYKFEAELPADFSGLINSLKG